MQLCVECFFDELVYAVVVTEGAVTDASAFPAREAVCERLAAKLDDLALHTFGFDIPAQAERLTSGKMPALHLLP